MRLAPAAFTPPLPRGALGRQSGRYLQRAASRVGLKPDPRSRAALWVGLQADSVFVQRDPSG